MVPGVSYPEEVQRCAFCHRRLDANVTPLYPYNACGTCGCNVIYLYVNGVPDVPADDPLPVDPLRFWRSGLRLERPRNFAPQPLPRCNPQQRQLQRTPPKVPRPPRHNRVAERNRA